MGQARARYAGDRDSAQRQPRHANKPAANRQGKPYVKVPPRDSAPTASIFKTRSFQFLVNAVGAENIALGLQSSMTRVDELMKGERFTPETAFHMETTLGLPHGFFDQPHPALPIETIERLKAPLDFVNANDELDLATDEFNPAATSDSQTSSPEENLPEETDMPKKATGGTPVKSKTSRRAAPLQQDVDTPRKGPRSKRTASSAAIQQQPLALEEGINVEQVRRDNLHVLTSRNGSKARLGVVMEMTGSNMAHRFYGKKRMDSAEANRFTGQLGLPAGWLDTPRSEAEIPESVALLLTPASRGRGPSGQAELPQAGTKDVAQEKAPASRKRAQKTQTTATGDAAEALPNSVDVVPANQTAAAGREDHVADAIGQPVHLPSEERDEVAPGEIAANPEPTPSVAAKPLDATTQAATVTRLDNLDGIAPVAEALIKTLAGKARTGRLDELKALELLQHAILL
jgi:hypothetical protein